MSFPRYPEYKDSGVEWLGEVPGHWGIPQIKRTTYLKARVGWKGLTSEEFREKSFAYLVTGSDFREKFVKWDACYQVDQDRYEDDPFIQLKNGDLLITKDGTIGKLAIVSNLDRPACLNSGIFVARPLNTYTTDFMYWILTSNVFAVFCDLESFGSTINHLYQNVFERFTFPAPPLPEQTQIAAFLDRETAKIDALVAEQRRLMALLKEKRQAVISHAVTRGLNPHAPLKPSGIEWLGDVPAHWDVLPIKRIVSVPITDGPHETPNFIDDGVPFVSAEAVSSGSINFSRVRACISEEDNTRYSLKYAPKLHDIYMVKSGATTGITAIVEDRTDFNIWSPLAAIRCNEGSVPHFVLNFMRSKHFQEAVTLNWSFGTQQNIGMGVIENLACTVPPVAEQLEIAQMLKSESAKFDTLTTEAQRAIDLLQERRTALISAAVTGQIDVRGAV